MRIPKIGRAGDELVAELRARQSVDTDWRGGRVFSLVYHAGKEHEEVVARAHAVYASCNLLNPLAFKSLKELERDVIAMAVDLMHGPAAATGTVTSGGTESILCAVAAYRDRARVRRPELIVPRTAHPAFDKAAHYLGVKLVKVDVGDDFRAQPRAIEKKISRRTIAIVGSAPQYPHGVVDPIGELGAIGLRHRVPLHVDACVGGFVLPWLEKLGRSVPRWDFRVPGVTSISADLHKFGYAGKGASALLWRSLDDMKHQIFVATEWAGGVYASPTMIGTRPGGPIAGAWAALQALGESGYLALAQQAIDAADRLRTGILAIPGLSLVGRGDATIVTFTGPNMFAVADRLETRGWSVDRQMKPPSIHLTVTSNHAPIVDDYLRDLREAVAESPRFTREGTAPMYGMVAKVPLRRLVASRVRDTVARMYAP
jgi:glutamate/tyrosine decarboxylase-like PLP-dependent enzyme